MSVDNRTLLEILEEKDFSNILLLERIIQQIVCSNNNEEIRELLRKMHFSFIANNDNYRMQSLEKLEKFFSQFPLQRISALCSDSLVGNYLALLLMFKKIAIIDVDSARDVIMLIPKLEYKEDLFSFGFPYPEQVFLDVDERISALPKNDIENLAASCVFLFQLDYIKKNKTTVESIRQIFASVGKTEYSLKSSLIKSLSDEDVSSFFSLLRRFGININSEQEVITGYCDFIHTLEQLSLPIYFKTNNIRFNGTMFNDNFTLLLYKDSSGIDKLIFPFRQVNFFEVGKVFDPESQIFYTPRERYGRLLLRDISSFKNVETIEAATPEKIKIVASMDEDAIAEKIRLILKDANLTHHGPIEIVDILTQYLFVNNTDDLRFSGFILKGSSFDAIHLNTIAGQLLKACHSVAQIVFLVFTSRLDDQAQTFFIKECNDKRKNFCIINRNELARLFSAYDVI
ncbi:MAG: hypothetical protein ACFCUE_03960 [Candidatus Bathyarchaeia archaeon]